ncbi:hypothetical protein LXL04_011024 [Taraxacum kok-saghyz]
MSDGDVTQFTFESVHQLQLCNSLQVLGRYQEIFALPFVSGSDYAGVVESVGPTVNKFKISDPVCSVVGVGSEFPMDVIWSFTMKLRYLLHKSPSCSTFKLKKEYEVGITEYAIDDVVEKLIDRGKLVNVLTPSTLINGVESVDDGSIAYGYAFVDYAALRFWDGSINDDASCASCVAVGALLMQISPAEVLFESQGKSPFNLDLNEYLGKFHLPGVN